MTNDVATYNDIPFLLYTQGDDSVRVQVRIQDETLWLTQKQMAILFNVGVPAVNKHLTNIFEEGELINEVVISKMEITTQHGAIADKIQSREVNHYNLDAIISVGYRVNSKQATMFRQWATQTLKEYIIKGFVMDDERLKQGEQTFGKDYFKELLETVRSIRSSEQRIWLQITDIFKEISSDYDKKSEMTSLFYAMVQNKFHYAITGQTAPEIISKQADSTKPYMGLTSFKNSPDGRVIKSDVNIAKNYLSESEIKKLDRTVSMFFDYLENLIEKQTVLTMQNLADNIDKFLNFNEFDVLPNLGKVSKNNADKKAYAEYDEFNKQQKIKSDFEKQIKKSLKTIKGEK